jgi:hypothetical protein
MFFRLEKTDRPRGPRRRRIDGVWGPALMKSGHYYPDEREQECFLRLLERRGIDRRTIEILPIPKKHKTNNPDQFLLS